LKKKFNVTGICLPEVNYMVDIKGKLEQIKELVDEQAYFTINRGRQYGKTTTLYHLEHFLSREYTVLFLSFEGLGDESFANPEIFCQTFLGEIHEGLGFTKESEAYREAWLNPEVVDFNSLNRHIGKMTKGKKLVILIDEVDKISNNRVFLQFLSMLRKKFLARQLGKDFTFHSVILAGVYNIKNIKMKMIQEGNHSPMPTEGQIYNSPWNIAVDFEVEMSFNVEEIISMLDIYEGDHQTGMDTRTVAEKLFAWTSGYPSLVSRLCKLVDEKLDKDWSVEGIANATSLLLKEQNTLFDDLGKNLQNHPEVYQLMYDVLIHGRRRSFNLLNPTVELAHRYGYIKEINGSIKVSNRIFEILITNYFISKDEETSRSTGVLYGDVVQDGRFNMALCLEKFARHYREIYNQKDSVFLEREERLIFLTYLKPLLNGRGRYHLESGLTDERRIDIVVDFGSDEFIVELKRWDGISKHEKAYGQLLGYMDKKQAQKGYLMTFGGPKKAKAEWVTQPEGKLIFDVIV